MKKTRELTAFWYETERDGRPASYGVTAFSLEDAAQLLRAAGYSLEQGVPVRVTEGITVQELDQNHVVPNMGPIPVRGVWFPFMNMRG